MYEVVVTYRSDFSERVVERRKTEAEAQEAARLYACQNYDKVVRALVRTVHEVKTKNN